MSDNDNPKEEGELESQPEGNPSNDQNEAGNNVWPKPSENVEYIQKDDNPDNETRVDK